MEKIKVRLGKSGYEIRIGSGLLTQVSRRLKESGFSDKLVIITNPVVERLYGEALGQKLTSEGFRVTTLLVPDGEEQKSLENAGRLYNELSDFYAERTTPILALGGGVIGDLAGFVAATYLRGVPLVQVPTTLLSQVDSSIGGKVAVNHGQMKNKIGAFYQPKLVVSDVSTLKTLPHREMSNGLAEVIKSAAIRDEDFFTYLEKNLDDIKALDLGKLEEVVFRTAKIKAEVVGQDERDLGLRNILNFGHTVGHAIESASDFRMGHGESVAVGMVAAAKISNRLGIFDISELGRLRGLIKQASLPIEIVDIDVDRVMQVMNHDKKIISGKIRFVLPKTIGDVFITDEVSPSLVEEVLAGWNE